MKRRRFLSALGWLTAGWVLKVLSCPSHAGLPKKTDHLFSAVIPTTAKQVQVVATDRFGKQYTAEYAG